jgi:hypothetical protein
MMDKTEVKENKVTGDFAGRDMYKSYFNMQNEITQIGEIITKLFDEMKKYNGKHKLIENEERIEKLPYTVEEKINFNSLKRNKDYIFKYMNFEGYINEIYSEKTNEQFLEHLAYIDFIEGLYANQKNIKQKDNTDKSLKEVINLYSDDIFDAILKDLESFIKIDRSLTHIKFEIKNMLLKIILVKAFIDCNILENPIISELQ